MNSLCVSILFTKVFVVPFIKKKNCEVSSVFGEKTKRRIWCFQILLPGHLFKEIFSSIAFAVLCLHQYVCLYHWFHYNSILFLFYSFYLLQKFIIMLFFRKLLVLYVRKHDGKKCYKVFKQFQTNQK